MTTDKLDQLRKAAELLPRGSAITAPVSWLLDEEPEQPEMDRGMLSDYTAAEVAEKIDRSSNTVRRWCAIGGILGAYRLGRRWMIPVAGLQKLRETGGKPPPYESTHTRKSVNIGAWRDV